MPAIPENIQYNVEDEDYQKQASRTIQLSPHGNPDMHAHYEPNSCRSSSTLVKNIRSADTKLDERADLRQ